MVLLPNATVSTRRGTTPINHHIRVQVQSPKPVNMTPEGVQVSTTILADPGTDWRTGDIVTIEQMDGFTDLDQTAKRDVLSASRAPGPLPVIWVFLRGTIQ